VEEQGFCNKMCSAMVGACLGVLLFVGSIPLLGWNEFNFVRNVKILDHVKDNVVEAGCAPLDSTMGKPVWVSCPVAQTYDFTTDGRLTALMAVMKNMYSPSKSLKGAALSRILKFINGSKQRQTRISMNISTSCNGYLLGLILPTLHASRTHMTPAAHLSSPRTLATYLQF
jgi:hypothetical protein